MEAGNKTAKALGESGTLPYLRKLELERSYLDSEGICALVEGEVACEAEFLIVNDASD